MTKTQGRRRSLGILGILLPSILFVCPCAFALNPALDVSQYAHTSWKVRDGFTKGAIFAIAQTPDGYLWLGTESGLVRFDGVRPVSWQPPSGQQLPGNFVNALLAARDGTLWIGTQKGLASWKDGKFSIYREVGDSAITALIEDHEGTVWIGAYGNPGGNLCAVGSGTLECYGTASFGRGVYAFYEDHRGSLWVSSLNGLWRWKPGRSDRYSYPGGVTSANWMAEDDSGTLLLSTTKGLKKLASERIDDYTFPGITGEFTPTRGLRSSDGSLWLGSQQGLLHLHQGRTDIFKSADGLSADFVLPIFEDREGSIWVGTQEGLDRFRDVTVPTISRKQGLSNPSAWSVLATRDGSIWIATADGLNQWENGHVTLYRSQKALGESGQKLEHGVGVGRAAAEIANSGLTGDPWSLGQDKQGRLWASTSDGVFYFESGRFVRVPGVPSRFTWSLVGDDVGNIWISNSEAGLLRVTPRLVVERVAWSQLQHKYARALLSDPSQSGLWLGFADGGVAYFNGGQVRASYSAADGLGNGQVTDLRFGSRGTLWVGTEGGLSRIRDGRVMTLASKNGLPCDTVHWSMEDDDHFVWVYMSCGLVRIARSELDAWVNDPKWIVQFTMLGFADGVRTYEIPSGFPPKVTKSLDGRIWFFARDGVSVLDPRHLPFNKMPPPVHVEQITADRKSYYDSASAVSLDASRRVRLPALSRDLQIDYTALSLVAPEKVMFRYKLEGYDREWVDAGNRRQAFYANLPPKNYTFHVKACNNSGVWNETGTFLDFTVVPAYYQTLWFRSLCVAALLATLWGLYQLRLRQLAREFNLGLEARVSERTRIARELHDSLLQGFQGLMFRLQAVREFLPGRPSEALRALDIALERGDKVIVEGRDTISDLRQSTISDRDLAQALTALGEELAAQSENGAAPCVRVLVEGKQRELDPVLRDEIYRIAREALRNAFRHARAQKIEAEIMYGDSEFLLHVRDDGIGMALEVADQGARAGHWGLPGMRERAKSFGGKLEVWSEHGAGTEIELTVPATVSYGNSGKSDARYKPWFLRKKN